MNNKKNFLILLLSIILLNNCYQKKNNKFENLLTNFNNLNHDQKNNYEFEINDYDILNNKVTIRINELKNNIQRFQYYQTWNIYNQNVIERFNEVIEYNNKELQQCKKLEQKITNQKKFLLQKISLIIFFLKLIHFIFVIFFFYSLNKIIKDENFHIFKQLFYYLVLFFNLIYNAISPFNDYVFNTINFFFIDHKKAKKYDGFFFASTGKIFESFFYPKKNKKNSKFFYKNNEYYQFSSENLLFLRIWYITDNIAKRNFIYNDNFQLFDNEITYYYVPFIWYNNHKIFHLFLIYFGNLITFIQTFFLSFIAIKQIKNYSFPLTSMIFIKFYFCLSYGHLLCLKENNLLYRLFNCFYFFNENVKNAFKYLFHFYGNNEIINDNLFIFLPSIIYFLSTIIISIIIQLNISSKKEKALEKK